MEQEGRPTHRCHLSSSFNHAWTLSSIPEGTLAPQPASPWNFLGASQSPLLSLSSAPPSPLLAAGPCSCPGIWPLGGASFHHSPFPIWNGWCRPTCHASSRSHPNLSCDLTTLTFRRHPRSSAQRPSVASGVYKAKSKLTLQN